MDFEYKKLFQLRKMSRDVLCQYYKDLRQYECENDIPVKGIQLRKKIYFLIKLILKIDKITTLRTSKLIKDERKINKKSKIYACTHAGRYDFESMAEKLGEQGWLIVGDPNEIYLTKEGHFLNLNGSSYFDMDDKNDAHTVNVRQRKILLNGGNEIVFPECAWNLDPIFLVGDIHPGVIKRAMATNSVIIPVGIEQKRGKYLKHYYINIGHALDFNNMLYLTLKEKCELLKNEMIRLKWEILEKYCKEKRENIKENWQEAFNDFIAAIMSDPSKGYTKERIEETKFVDRDKVQYENPDEIFGYLDNLESCKTNPYLLQKQRKYDKF